MSLEQMIARHRRRLADVLDGLPDGDWTAPSLCEGWTVAHVVAHITMPFRYSSPQVLFGLLKARGRWDRFAGALADRDAALPRGRLIAALRDNAENPWKPPGGGVAGALSHDVIHGLDITRALGLDSAAEPGVLRAVLDNAVTPRSLEHFGVAIDGVALEAPELGWAYGAGAPIAGNAADLVLLLTGRPVDPDDFSGAGTARLTGRLRSLGPRR